MSAIKNTYNYNDYSVKIRARRTRARKIARRKAITCIVAGLAFVIGINVLLAIKDSHAEAGADKAITDYRKVLDHQSRTDCVVVDGRIYTFDTTSARQDTHE